MPELTWSEPGTRFYESGVDRGVLYVEGDQGVPWNGLISVDEKASGGDTESYYLDGIKYLSVPSREEFEATVTAFTYPDEFSLCVGSHQPRLGLFITQQRRKQFGLSYRTMIGNDLSGKQGYKIHLIYNAITVPSDRSNTTLGETTDPTEFTWDITTCPPALNRYHPTAHIVVDSRFTDPSVLELVESYIYGTESDPARLPSLDELTGMYDTISTLTVVDNGDGTFTVTAPADVIRMIDDDTFSITASTAVFIDEDSYTLSSE